MILLSCPYKLAFLRKLLRCSFPESLKVHGALHYVINKNPFRLEVLVDQWPDFTSVICRPLMEEMKDPSDPHTNTYFVFSTNQHNLSHMLQDPQVVNWNHSFQLQGCQPELQDVLHIISSKQGSHIQTVSNVLYMRHGKRCANELAGLHSTSEFQFSPLRPDEAQLVNAQWGFGGNERSENYIKRCIQNFPTVCARKPGLQQPISWVLSEQSAEMRMGYTERAYRSHRLFGNVATKLISTLESAEVPMYCHVAADNINSHRACMAVGYSPVGKWQQWKFQPH
ncbi:glycine N-acyltransferase-like protein 2 [Gastrophryne carolinensis]